MKFLKLIPIIFIFLGIFPSTNFIYAEGKDPNSYKILSKNNIKLSLAVYPWPHQLENDVVNSIHVKIWQEFCQNKCEKFINYFPIFFEKINNSSYLETYKKYYFKNDPHFNKTGHKVLAAELIRSF